MNREQIQQKAKIVAMNWSHTTDPRSPSELLTDFALVQYEAGQRAERERIVHQFEAISQSDDGTCYADYSDAIDAFIDKLRAGPAESGE